MCTHDIEEPWPIEPILSTVLLFSGEVGEALLRARFKAGSRSLLCDAAVTLATLVNCCGERRRSTLGAKVATAVDMLNRSHSQKAGNRSRCRAGWLVGWWCLSVADQRALQLSPRPRLALSEWNLWINTSTCKPLPTL